MSSDKFRTNSAATGRGQGGFAMIVRISRGKVKEGSWASFEAAWREVYGSLSPAGLRGRALIQDARDPDRGASISVWDDESSAVSATRELQNAMQKLQAFYVGEYEIEEGDLRSSEGLLGSG
jgi:heme-degrading monooxygenase HmoA